MRKFIAQGIYFEELKKKMHDPDPVMGTNKGSIGFGDTYYRRRSKIEDIADDFETRMKNFKLSEKRKEERVVEHPEDFTVSVAYNKSGYQLIPKKDLTNT